MSFLLDDKIAFDFGPHTLEALLDSRVDPNKIDRVLISHMHLDHYVGVAELLWYRSIHEAEDPLLIVGPEGIRGNTLKLMDLVQTPPLWNKSQIEKKIEFVENQDFDSVKIFHSSHTVPSVGYRVDYEGKTIFYSGDTSYSKEVVRGATNADILIHEMTYTDEKKDIANYWGHSTYSDVLRVFEESSAAQLVPVHFTRESSEYVKRRLSEIQRLIYPPDTLTLI